MKKVLIKYGLFATLLSCTGCDTTESTMVGGVGGAALGGAAGYGLGGKSGGIIGSIIGGGLGAAGGHAVGRQNEEKKVYSAENARVRSEITNSQPSGRDYELQQLQREIELKRLKNEKLEQELERKRLKKEQRELEMKNNQ